MTEPSILLVTLDTTRADRIGAYGHRAAVTPTIDRLAREGILFEAALAPTPITLPSHASILTGVDPPAHGVRDNGMFTLGPEALLVSEVLGEAGWRTGAFVGTYVLDARYGLDQGFEVYGGPPVSHVWSGVGAERPAAAVVDEAIDWLETLDPDERFFAWVHFYDPHEPYTAPEAWARKLQDPYDAEIAFCDEQLGRLLGFLAASGRDEKLLVAVTADHGESLGEHGEKTHGIFVYQSSIRVPLVLSGAALRRGRGTRVSEPVGSVELAATLLDLAGVPRERMPAVRGVSLLERRPRDLYLETHLPYHSLGWRALRGMVSDGHKLVDGSRPELFDLRRDPGEVRNLAAEQPERVAALRRSLGERSAPGVGLGWAEDRDLDPQDHARLRALGYLTGNADGARDPFDPALPDPRVRIGDLRILAEAAAALSEWAAVTNAPPAATAWQEAERVAPARQRLEAARAALAPAFAANPGSFQFTANLGAIESRLGHHEEAIRLLEKAARLQPAELENRHNLADAYHLAGREKNALRTLHGILATDSKFMPVYMWMTGYHAGRDEYGRAVGWLTELARLAEPDPALHREIRARLATLTTQMKTRGQEPVPPDLSAQTEPRV